MPPLTVALTTVLASEQGAAITFTESGGLWSWTGLTTPTAPKPWSVSDEGTAIKTLEGDDRLAPGWTLVEQGSNKITFEQEMAAAGLRCRRVFSFGPAANVLRIETSGQSPGGDKVLKRAGLLDARITGEAFVDTGAAPASFPVFGTSLFVGIEHVSGTCHGEGDTVHAWQAPTLKVGEAWKSVATVVVGWLMPSDCSIVTGSGRIRDAFLQYLDTIRLKPADLELHTNT
ncbi:MAG: hypothetical protein EXS38_06500 [Opitutus sp.]|nr:hypothetical protein [Opitutus sp.]